MWSVALESMTHVGEEEIFLLVIEVDLIESCC